MKIAILLAVATVTISSLPFRAQQEIAAAQQSAKATAGATRVDQSANVHAQTNTKTSEASGSVSADVYLRAVNGELVGTVNARIAKAGDSVVVRTKEEVRAADGTIIPEGSRLIGHVSYVQAKNSDHATSSLSIAFDRAELKNGQSLAIHPVIQLVAAQASAVAASK
jgi:hypothetical protein